jgi:hypothetical protein
MELPLLSTAYLPPVEYINVIAKYGNVAIEAKEHFVKQTYRNRAVILGANGPLPLIIPLKKGKNNQQLITETEIDYSSNWQTVHWRAIASAYGGSPFFEHYADYFQPYYSQRFKFLFDYNQQIVKLLLKLMKIKNELFLTEEYTAVGVSDTDFRYTISPKVESVFNATLYRQVFSEKYGFISNLSSIDLLFCTGNKSIQLFEH